MKIYFILNEVQSREKKLKHSKEVEQSCSKIIALVIKALVKMFLIKMGQFSTTDSCSNVNFT